MVVDENRQKEIMNLIFDPVKLKEEMIKAIDKSCREANPYKLAKEYDLTVEEVEETLDIIINSREMKELMLMSM